MPRPNASGNPKSRTLRSPGGFTGVAVAQGTSVLVRTDYVAGSDHRAQPHGVGQAQAADAPRMVQMLY
jgi:hypothetical protein